MLRQYAGLTRRFNVTYWEAVDAATAMRVDRAVRDAGGGEAGERAKDEVYEQLAREYPFSR